MPTPSSYATKSGQPTRTRIKGRRISGVHAMVPTVPQAPSSRGRCRVQRADVNRSSPRREGAVAPHGAVLPQHPDPVFFYDPRIANASHAPPTRHCNKGLPPVIPSMNQNESRKFRYVLEGNAQCVYAHAGEYERHAISSSMPQFVRQQDTNPLHQRTGRQPAAMAVSAGNRRDGMARRNIPSVPV
jgi:hypothetical protein